MKEVLQQPPCQRHHEPELEDLRPHRLKKRKEVLLKMLTYPRSLLLFSFTPSQGQVRMK